MIGASSPSSSVSVRTWESVVVLDDVDPAVVGQGDVLDDLLDPDGVGRAVVLVDGVDDARLGSDDGLDREARPEADVLDDLEVGRVDHGQGQEVPDPVDGHDHILLGHVDRNEGDDFGVDIELVEVDIGIAELAAEGLGDVLLGQVAELDEGSADGQAVLLLEFEGGLQLIDRENLFPQKQFAQVRCHFLFHNLMILDNSCQLTGAWAPCILMTAGGPYLFSSEELS